MNSLKRIYLACRAAVAELNPLMYLLAVGILIGLATLTLFMNVDSDRDGSQLLREFSFWDPASIISLITSTGWIAGLIVCGTIHNRWFKEENHAVRTLSLPLSNGERFATMLLLYLGFVPLVCFGLPLLLVFLLYPLAPDVMLLPATAYLWKALLVGFLVHAAATAFWFQPFLVFRNKVFFVIVAMVGLVIFYIINTHGSIAETLQVPYTSSATQNSQVVGMASYELLENSTKSETIEVKYSPDESVYYIIQSFFLLLMLVTGGLALTKKTA